MAKITITEQSNSTDMTLGQTTSISVLATMDEGEPTYQWYGPEGIIAGATTETLELGAVVRAGTRTYYAVVKGAGATDVTSDPIVISDVFPEYITGDFAHDIIALCSQEAKDRFRDLQAIRRVTIPDEVKVLRSEQLEIFMASI